MNERIVCSCVSPSVSQWLCPCLSVSPSVSVRLPVCLCASPRLSVSGSPLVSAMARVRAACLCAPPAGQSMALPLSPSCLRLRLCGRLLRYLCLSPRLSRRRARGPAVCSCPSQLVSMVVSVFLAVSAGFSLSLACLCLGPAVCRRSLRCDSARRRPVPQNRARATDRGAPLRVPGGLPAATPFGQKAKTSHKAT